MAIERDTYVKIAGWLGFAAALVGAVVLAGWSLDIAVLKIEIPGHATMKANTAISFVCLGAALTILVRFGGGENRSLHVLARGLALVAVTLGMLTSIEYFAGIDFGIDQSVIRDPEFASYSPLPGRMSPVTCLNIVFFGLALYLYKYDRNRLVVNILTVVAGALSVLGVIGAVYGVVPFVPLAMYTQIAIPTSLVFFMLFLGIRFSQPDYGVMKVFSDEGSAGLLSRWLLPSVILVELVTGKLRLILRDKDLVTKEYGSAVSAFVNACLIIGFFVIALRALKRSEDDLRRHRERLEEAVEERTAELTEVNERLRAEAEERKRAVEALHQASAYNRSLIEASLDPLVTIGPDGRITDVNAATEAVTGRNRSELVGTDFSDYFIDPAKARMVYEEVFREGYVRDYELEVRHMDGHTTPVLYNASVYRDEAGNVTGVFAVARDITERKKTDESLKESETKYRSLFDNMTSGFAYCKMVFDEKGLPSDFVYLDVNSAFGKLTGLEGVVGKRVSEVIPGIKELHPEIFEFYGRVALTGKPDRLELELKPLGIWISVSAYSTKREYFVAVFDNITERKLSEEKIKRDMERLAALRVIDTAISGSLDLRVTLNVLLEQTIKQLHMDAACVLLFDQHSQMLEYALGHGFSKKRITLARVRFGHGYAGRAAMERKTVVFPAIDNIHDDTLPWHLIEEEGFKAYIGVPLIAKGQVKGVLELFSRTPLDPEMEWLEFAEALASQAAIALDSAEMFEQLERSHSELLTAYDTTIEGWSRALDYRDKETEGHSIRVTEMAVRVCKALGMTEKELVHVRRGALLHDIGKLGVPDDILLKPGALTDEEFAVIKTHPDIAFKLLSPVEFLRPAMDIPYCHHERWDGSGYPRGLKGEEIPLAARIFAIIDVWDALRSDRPYRPAWPEEKVREYLRSEAGTQFDAKIVDVFLSTECVGEQEKMAG